VVQKLRRGGARIKLFSPQPAATERIASEPWYACAGWRYAALYVESADALRDVVAAVDASGGSVLVAPSSHRADAVVAVVRDPEGNVWELLWEAQP
jgi:catechol 2,3-dioxygenase-like lactoylglutathione lyase family enzyme